MRDDWGHPYYPPSRPREAKGGIKAQSKNRGFAQKWWAQRWIAVLESFDIGGRLQRGRSYARRGQVLSIDIGKGVVTASVQGSRPKPYAVQIRVKTLAGKDWSRIAKVLRERAVYAAKLLGGEMPQDIEEVFAAAQLSLFPARGIDLVTDCSCPDWSNPCKHIAAVYYLLGEEFDRDPFLIFTLRGLTREELGGLVGTLAKPAEAAPEPPEPLPADAALFWNGGELPADLTGVVQPPPVAAALVKRLGPFPFWRGELPLAAALEPVYRAASEHAVKLLEN